MTKIRVKKWIQGAHLKKGALHRDLGVPQGKKIPDSLLQQAAHAKGVIAKRARFALNAKKFKH